MVKFDVVVPKGAVGGQEIKVKTPSGEHVLVTLPANAREGMVMTLNDPKAVSPRRPGGGGGGPMRSPRHHPPDPHAGKGRRPSTSAQLQSSLAHEQSLRQSAQHQCHQLAAAAKVAAALTNQASFHDLCRHAFVAWRAAVAEAAVPEVRELKFRVGGLEEEVVRARAAGREEGRKDAEAVAANERAEWEATHKAQVKEWAKEREDIVELHNADKHALEQKSRALQETQRELEEAKDALRAAQAQAGALRTEKEAWEQEREGLRARVQELEKQAEASNAIANEDKAGVENEPAPINLLPRSPKVAPGKIPSPRVRKKPREELASRGPGKERDTPQRGQGITPPKKVVRNRKPL